MQWRCAKRHVFSRTGTEVKSGRWCPTCTNTRRYTIEKMRELARSRRGECLSRTYRPAPAKLAWRCKEGHRWRSTSHIVVQGSWCPHCSPRAPLSLEQMHELAAAHGGRCLSRTFRPHPSKVRWECANGHRWSSTGTYAKSGRWCVRCHRVGIEDMQEAARKRGGECLSKRYAHRLRLRWRCAKGHEWLQRGTEVKNSGTWCPTCAQRPHLGIEDMHEIARKRGWTCLAKRYRNGTTPIPWQCDQGHEFKAAPANVKVGSGCPHCAGTVKRTLGELQKLARERGGKCLAKEYRSANSPVRWRCAKGHEWISKPVSVRLGGHWCRRCAYEGMRVSIATIEAVAALRGGRCLTPVIAGLAVFRCARGHEWRGGIQGVLYQGVWCKHSPCATLAGRIETLRVACKNHGGGEFDASSVHRVTDPVRFTCRNGHSWESKPKYVMRGDWCPTCAPRAGKRPTWGSRHGKAA